MGPNLFVLGAAKCGTSSLHDILGQHPDIHACWPKEPTFFNWPAQQVRNPIQYFKLFDSPKRYRLESSVAYLMNPATPAILRTLFPNARFIVSLRHPKARAHSLYINNRIGGWEPIPTFVGALRAEEERTCSIDFFQTCQWDYWTYLYCRSSLYDEQLARYFNLFERQQLQVVSLAELARDPLALTQRILRFLELDPAPASHFNFDPQLKRETTKLVYDDESDKIMTSAFRGLTERTETLLGHALDWSM